MFSPTNCVSGGEDSLWKEDLKGSLRTAEDLYRAGFIPKAEIPRYDQVLQRYGFRLSRYYAALIDRTNPACPIRRQAIPDPRELETGTEAFLADPLHDLEFQPVGRITHRYPNRALLHLTPNCSMYCRYCFRKSLLNELSDNFFEGDLRTALDYLVAHTEIEEVIFSGGDPLMANPRTLESTVAFVSKMPHLRRLRFHTRTPVTLPSRVTESLAQTLTEHGLPTAVVVHFNHPREITPQSQEACYRLKRAGAMVLNQSVLLRGVNDQVAALGELSAKLFEIGVLPYYLHHPDRAQGTEHFDVSKRQGLAIYDGLRAALPGYLVPRYVVDDGVSPFKRAVAESL